ncbi:MAG: cob(I)yrinic acid a,c-diamide adenosyltransferase [Planctomycetota bacterium]
MRIYTKSGDNGDTGLYGKARVRKHDTRIEAYGTVDEVSSLLGLLASEPLPPADQERIRQVQATLFEIGADLATLGGHASVTRVAAHTRELESWIDAADADLPELRSFILPGGHREAALCHMARTVCRRAERRVWQLADTTQDVPHELAVYLNRLSDLLFVWARTANRRRGVGDVLWSAPPSAPS